MTAEASRLPPFTRREALRLLAAHIPLALAACGRPEQTIVPYVQVPDDLVPGEARKFATALPLGGYARGALVTAVDGRPIKVDGNPDHPASLGATDPFLEADILSLYDPDRSQAVQNRGQIAAWEDFERALASALQELRAQGGEGLRLLTGPVTSPTLARQLEALFKTYPQAVWHAYDATEDAATRAGAELAFGRPVAAVPHLERVKTIVTFDADPIGAGPDQIRCARAFAARRSPQAESFSRVYAIESTQTSIGAKADHRLAIPPHLIAEAIVALAKTFDASMREAALPRHVKDFVVRAAQDLQASHGEALVLAGRTLPAETHALAHWINAQLNAPVDIIDPVDRPLEHSPQTLADLADNLKAGSVSLLLVLGVNPVSTAPAHLDLAHAIARAPFTVHAGVYPDETAAASLWHLPLSHPLESWSDLRTTDGTASITQPLIKPLYRTRTVHEVMQMLLGEPRASSHELARETWTAAGGKDFETWWHNALRKGIIPDTASRPLNVTARRPDIPMPLTPVDDFTLVLRPDPCIWDGSYANNAWLQELPKPLSAQVWGNALTIGPADAKRLGVTRGDMVRLTVRGQQLDIVVDVQPGHAAGVAGLPLGYGRTRAGAIGNGIGTSAQAILQWDAPWCMPGARLEKTGKRGDVLIATRTVRSSDLGADEIATDYPLLQVAELGATQMLPGNAQLPSLLPDQPVDPSEPAWGMVIDTSLCIGCNACVVACQSENNVPVVGPEEAAWGRQMHWLRIDAYERGTADDPQTGFQPVPCMHCEHAPCEPVCPVAASVHDAEGLNVQVYNRCIGTRFCEANCPYKVRRFNFFGYADGQEYANLGLDPYRSQRNPEVTVRARGVMEKCTYCVQRISAARRASERDHKPIAAPTTACQDACPTQAIVFGNLHQHDSAVSQRKHDARHYALLAELGTRPRTTYLADLRNPSRPREDRS